MVHLVFGGQFGRREMEDVLKVGHNIKSKIDVLPHFIFGVKSLV